MNIEKMHAKKDLLEIHPLLSSLLAAVDASSHRPQLFLGGIQVMRGYKGQ
jgi:hypothetical protein